VISCPVHFTPLVDEGRTSQDSTAGLLRWGALVAGAKRPSRESYSDELNRRTDEVADCVEATTHFDSFPAGSRGTSLAKASVANSQEFSSVEAHLRSKRFVPARTATVRKCRVIGRTPQPGTSSREIKRRLKAAGYRWSTVKVYRDDGKSGKYLRNGAESIKRCSAS